MDFSAVVMAFSSIIFMAIANAGVAYVGFLWGKARGHGIWKKDEQAGKAYSQWESKPAIKSPDEVIENDLAVEKECYTRDFAYSMIVIGSILCIGSLGIIYLMWKATHQEAPHLYKYISYLGHLPYLFVHDYGFFYLIALIFCSTLLVFRSEFFKRVVSQNYRKEKTREMSLCSNRKEYERVKVEPYMKEKYKWFFLLRKCYIPLICTVLLALILNIFVPIILLEELGDYADDYLIKFNFLNVPRFALEDYRNFDWASASAEDKYEVFYTLYVDGEEKVTTKKYRGIALENNLDAGWRNVSVTARSLGMKSKDIEEEKNIYILPNIKIRLNTNDINVGEVIFPEFGIITRGSQEPKWMSSEGLITHLHSMINEANPDTDNPIALEEIQKAIKYNWFVDNDVVSNEAECVVLPQYYGNGANRLKLEIEINGTKISTKNEIITPGEFSDDSITCKLEEATDIILFWSPVDNAKGYAIIYNDGNMEEQVYLTTINNKAIISKEFLSQSTQFGIRIYSDTKAYRDTDIIVETQKLLENSGIDITSFLV